MKKTTNIMIVGVGGQGSLLASRLMGNVLLQNGEDVKVSEVHGMSQRGGSVVTYVKYGELVSSPIIDLGEADIIISFEQLEAARWVPYLKEGGKMIVSTQTTNPMPVIIGAMEYPKEIIEKIKALGVDIIAVNALEEATKLGNAKASNVVIMGAVSTLLEFEENIWQKALEECVPPKFLELNKNAFAVGQKMI